MNSDFQSKDKGYSQSQDVNQELEDGNKKPIIWWVIVGLLAFMLLAISAALIAVTLSKSESKKNALAKLGKEVSNTTECIRGEKEYNRGKEVCIARECIREANNLLTSIDDTKDPCEDFYKFSCGRYVYHNNIAIDSKYHSSFATVKNKLKLELKEILDQPISDGDFRGISMARTFYKSCLFREKRTDIQQFKYQQIQKILGDWPAKVGQWSPPSTYSWEENVVNLLKLNIYSGLGIGVMRDDRNITRNIILIGAPLSDFPYLSQWYKIKKPQPIPENPTVDERNLDLLKRKMAAVPFNPNNHQRMTIAEMKSKFQQVNWDVLLSIFPKEVHVVDDDIVNVASPNQLEHVLNVINSTKLRDVQNLMFETAMLQIPEIEAFTWEFCLYNTENLFRNIMSNEYIKKNLNAEVFSEVKDMSKEMKNVLIVKLMESDWLDEKTRQRAVDKVKKMLLLVGQQEEYFNEDFLMEDYKEIDMRANDYFNNNRNIEAMLVKKNFTKLRKPVRRDDWILSPLTVNAFNSLTHNVFIFPAAFLVFPIVSKKEPSYLSYGRLGSIIGHEMSHGFDSEGYQYNELGLEEMWWSKATYERFNKKQTCFEAQFNNTKDVVSGLSLNGKLKLAENMADTGGLKLAYTAFKKWLSEHLAPPALPHFHKYSPEQMFFITFANTWCTLYTDETRMVQLVNNTHALGRYRINFPLKNLREFGDVFNCSKTAKMRLDKRCELW